MAEDRKCAKCGTTFPYPWKLKRHLARKTPCQQIVTPEDLPEEKKNSNYTCKFCGRGFNQATGLSRHIKKSCKAITGNDDVITTHDGNEHDETMQKMAEEIELIKNEMKIMKEAGGVQMRPVKAEGSPIVGIDIINTFPKHLPVSVRNAVWSLYIGPEEGKGLCYCCGLEPILRSNFECGHILSRKNGGSNKIQNLRPVSSACNKSMGSKNMVQFAQLWGFPAPILSEMGMTPIEKDRDEHEFGIEDVYVNQT